MIVFGDGSKFIRYTGRDYQQGTRTFFDKKKGDNNFLGEKGAKGAKSVFTCKVLTNLNLNFLKKPFLGQKFIILEKGDSLKQFSEKYNILYMGKYFSE